MKKMNSVKFFLVLFTFLMIYSHVLAIGYSNAVGIPTGLKVKHNYSSNVMMGVYPSTLTFTKPSSDTVHIVNYLGGDIDDTGSWSVNTNTRIISNQENFGPFNGDHSVFWIYTNVSLDDQLLMCNIWKGVHSGFVSGDALFNVTGEGMHGTTEVWILEDNYGSEMWYEKARGFLVNGTLKHSTDYNQYEFISAGIPGIPGYSLFLIISVIAIISFIIIKKQKIK
jgi:hypothetical protein